MREQIPEACVFSSLSLRSSLVKPLVLLVLLKLANQIDKPISRQVRRNRTQPATQASAKSTKATFFHDSVSALRARRYRHPPYNSEYSGAGPLQA